MSRRNRKTAFTLVEMVVAAMVLAIGATAGLAAISAGLRSSRVAEEYSSATRLAQTRISEIESDPTNTLTSGEQTGQFEDPYQDYSYRQTVEQSAFTNLMKVTIEVSWLSGSTQRTAQFVTYECIPQQQSATGTASGA